jgi:toxin YoeB
LARRSRQATPTGQSERLHTFDRNFVEDLRYWAEKQPRVAARIMSLIEATMRDPFGGIGKPEQLRHLATGVWSRRITEEHRLVYRVTPERIDFLQARYHY